MHSKHTSLLWLIPPALCLLMLTLVGTIRPSGVLAVDCVGKPYGYPGCPIKATTSSKSSVSALCGNGVVDDGEECDHARFNGQTDCSEQCTLLYCGDGTITPYLDEECEPQTEEVYVNDPDTGALTTEKRFAETQECGTYCAPPTCDDNGNCSGGCKRKFFQNACPTSASSVSSGTAAATAASTATTTVSAGSSQAAAATTATSSRASTSTAAVAQNPSLCGNGIQNQNEECDDGNQISIDGCTAACRLPRCGDGIVQVTEQCDDGNENNSDSCSNTCMRGRCGDAIVQFGEQCDDGNQIQSDACTNACRIPLCGDGYVQTDEQCDDGNQSNNDSCTSACRYPTCGDGVVQLDEGCDDGNQNNNDSCSNACRRASCGDGLRQPGEECDDGNENNNDSCTNSCRLPVCGNALREGKEECDDGNQLNTDSCTNACRTARCGDGIVQNTEECDSSPRCTPICTLEPVAITSSVASTPSAAPISSTVSSAPLRAAAPTVTQRGTPPALIFTLVLTSAALLGGVGFALRGRLLGLFKTPKPTSIDDVPLDQIEMPWHKW